MKFLNLELYKLFPMLLFISMLFGPTQYKLIKMLLLGLSLLFIFIEFMTSKKKIFFISKKTLVWTGILTLVGVIGISIGYFNGVGNLSVGTVFVVWPWIYVLFISFMKEKEMEYLVQVIVWITLAIEVYSYIYILTSINIIPDFLFISLNAGERIGLHGSYIEYSAPALATLGFTVPMITAMNFFKYNTKFLSSSIIRITTVLGIMLIFIANRRALVYGLIASVVIIFLLGLYTKHKEVIIKCKKIGIIGMVSIIPFAVLFFDKFLNIVFNIYSKVMQTLNIFDSVTGDSVRSEQVIMLFNEWKNYPLFGKGLGTNVDGYIRSDTHTGSYELTYNALLFQVGLVGMAIYIFLFGWLIERVNRISKNNIELSKFTFPIVIGFMSFLIITATNPYLLKFDNLWTIFILLAFVNIDEYNKINEDKKV
ncbi:MAG: hypothetical protein ACRC17_07435 [Culicoidibacterales bacterium]